MTFRLPQMAVEQKKVALGFRPTAATTTVISW